jgi:hypothetical protein
MNGVTVSLDRLGLVRLSLDWLSWSNPVAIWWCFLLVASAANIAWWFWLRERFRSIHGWRSAVLAIEPLLLLSAVYVFGCAFRSVFPRADVQRICLFDTPLSSVFVGRSVATVAELCFAMQWAIVLRLLADIANSDIARNCARLIMPLIVIAECCSWYAVITTNYLGNVFENSLWTATYFLIAVALVRLIGRFRGIVQLAIVAAALGTAGYVVFMLTVDVPMYFARWHADTADGRAYFGLIAGLLDASDHWVVTHDVAAWKEEMPWMALYFSMAVWASLALASFGLVKHYFARYRVRAPFRRRSGRSVAVPVYSASSRRVR